MISLIDLNVPLAKSKEKSEELCSLMQFCNDLNPARHIGIVELPDTPKKSSKRGLADEEADLQQTLWGLRQSCDVRWVMPFDIHPSADAQTSRRSERDSTAQTSKSVSLQTMFTSCSWMFVFKFMIIIHPGSFLQEVLRREAGGQQGL